MRDMQKDQKRAIMILVGIVVSMLVMVIVGFILSQNTQNKYGGELTVANLTDYTKGKPSNKDSLEYIMYDLFRTVNLNQAQPVASNSVSDILIRDGTFSQKTDPKTGVTTVTFIVDIASLQQSYRVSYQWDANGGRQADGIDAGGTVVTCLPKDKLVYGEFSCNDMFTIQAAESDPILAYLPHATLQYNLSAVQDQATDQDNTQDNNQDNASPKLRIIAELLLTAADVRTDRAAAIETYKQAVREYITSVGLNPDDYTIVYQTKESSLY